MKIGNLEVYGVIYKIINKLNNKIYIGQTSQDGGFKIRYNYKGQGIERVYNYHKGRLKRKLDANKHLLSSIKKYGFKSFEINEIFDFAFSQEELNIKEQCWISIYKSDNKKYGYNNNIGGGSNKGFKHTEESKNKNRMSKLDVSKAIFCITTNETFLSIKQASEKYNIDRKTIGLACKGEYKYAGRNPITGEKMVWIYLKDYSEEEKINRLQNLEIDFQSKKVICLTTKEIFKSILEASRVHKKNHASDNAIGRCCKKTQNYCGKLKDGSKLYWMYYEEYIKYSKKEVYNIIHKLNSINYKSENNKLSKKVICITNGKIFSCIGDANEYCGFARSSGTIGMCCKRLRETSGKLIDGTKLKWMYYDEYIKQNKLLIHNVSLGQAI